MGKSRETKTAELRGAAEKLLSEIQKYAEQIEKRIEQVIADLDRLFDYAVTLTQGGLYFVDPNGLDGLTTEGLILITQDCGLEGLILLPSGTVKPVKNLAVTTDKNRMRRITTVPEGYFSGDNPKVQMGTAIGHALQEGKTTDLDGHDYKTLLESYSRKITAG